MKILCGLCGYEPVRGESLRGHVFRKHPELKLTTKRDKTGHMRRCCAVCYSQIDSFNTRTIRRHIHTTEEQRTGTVTTENVTASDLDRFLKKVNVNIALLKEAEKKAEDAEKKAKELSAKLIEYATKIVELQNQLASDH